MKRPTITRYLFVVVFLCVVSCSREKPKLNITLLDRKIGPEIKTSSTHEINNCSGVFNRQDKLEDGATFAVKMDNDVTIGEPYQSILITARQFYGMDERAVLLMVPPRTHIEFTVVWTRATFIGTAEVENDPSRRYHYKYYPIVDVQVIERNLPCP